MTKGTKIFRIIICILLLLTMLCSGFFALLFCSYISNEVMDEGYGIYVAGVSVTRENEDDVLGDGKVYYNPLRNTLSFDNVTIESVNTVVSSQIDLNIELIGENKFICTNEGYSIGIYAADYYLSKDLSIMGDGSLTIELPNKGMEAAGISASELTIATDVTVKTSDCEKSAHGIVCASALLIVDGATVTVNNGAAKYSSAVRVRGNAFFEEGTALNVTENPGTIDNCKGLSINGDLFLSKNVSLEVSINDEATELGECIRVSGLMDIGAGSTVKASSKNAYAIECFGTIKANKNAEISAVSDKKDVDIFCSGAVVNCGATVNAVTDALGGIHNKTEG